MHLKESDGVLQKFEFRQHTGVHGTGKRQEHPENVIHGELLGVQSPDTKEDDAIQKNRVSFI